MRDRVEIIISVIIYHIPVLLFVVYGFVVVDSSEAPVIVRSVFRGAPLSVVAIATE